MFCKENVSPILIFHESVLNGYEILCCDVTIRASAVRILILYKAPSCPSALSAQMFKALSDLISCDHPSVVMGDFNLPDITWTGPKPLAKSCQSKAFLDLCESHSLLQLVAKGTLGSNVLDLVLCNRSNIIYDLSLGPPVGASDHAVVTFKLNIIKEPTVLLSKRDFKAADFDAIRYYLGNVDWFSFLNSVETVDEKYELFITILSHCMELFVPIRRVPIHHAHLPQYLNSLLQKRSLAWDRARKYDTEVHWKAYKRLDHKFSRNLFKYNRSVENKIIHSKSKSAFYKLLNSRLRSRPSVTALVTGDGNIIRTDSGKAELLADTFASSFSPDFDLSEPYEQQFPTMSDSAWFYADEIYNLLSRWPPSYSVTPDGIPLVFIKNVAHIIASPLQHIFNLSFMRAEIPKRWKLSLVTPIPKKTLYP